MSLAELRYPEAIWAPWAYNPRDPSYYKDGCRPTDAVLHVMQGWVPTVLSWAKSGYTGASWHFSVGRDGTVYQHLRLVDGGYHAGIARARDDGTLNPPPRWSRWQGWGVNVNWYTIGIEHEGFAGAPFTEAQTEASIRLCRWLSEEIFIPYDREHFTSHSEIALIDRVNDFNTPVLREEHYQRMFAEEEQPMTPEEVKEFRDLQRLIAYDLAPAIRTLQPAVQTLQEQAYGWAWGFKVTNERLASIERLIQGIADDMAEIRAALEDEGVLP